MDKPWLDLASSKARMMFSCMDSSGCWTNDAITGRSGIPERPGSGGAPSGALGRPPAMPAGSRANSLLAAIFAIISIFSPEGTALGPGLSRRGAPGDPFGFHHGLAALAAKIRLISDTDARGHAWLLDAGFGKETPTVSTPVLSAFSIPGSKIRVALAADWGAVEA
jgi:hypothetical protein